MRRKVLLFGSILALLVQPLWTRAADVHVIAYQDAPLVIQQCQVDTSGAQPVLRTAFNVAGTKDIDNVRFRYQFLDAQGHVVAEAHPQEAGTFTVAKSYTSSQPAVTQLPAYASVTCAPAYAHFADGTTWTAPGGNANGLGVLPIVLGAAALAAGIAVAASSSSSSPSSPPVPPPTAPPPPSLTVSPALLTFSSSSGAPLQFTVSGGAPPYSIDASECTKFATVNGSSPGPYTVTPIVAATTGGECVVKVRSGNGERGNLAVVVQVPQLVVGALTFTGPTAPAQTLPLSGGAAPFTIDDSACKGIATVSAASGSGPFTVRPVASNGGGGSCALKVTSANHVTQQAPVTVAHTLLTVSPTYFTFASPTASGETLIASGGRAPYTIDLGKCALVTVTPASGSGPFTVAPNGKGVGSCVIVVRSADHQTQSVSIVIGATPLAVTPSSLTFTSPTAPAQTFTASGAVAPYKATAAGCTTLATLSGTSPTFTLTPVSSSPGGTCVIKVTSADHQEATVIASVSVGTTLSVTPVALSFVTPSSPTQSFSVSGGTAPYTIASPDCSGIATFTPTTLSSAGSVTVTPAGAGSCGITVEDSSAVKQSRSVAIVVGAPAFSVTPATLDFATPEAPAQDVAVSGGSPMYDVDDAACSSVATVSGSGTLPGTLTVTPVAVGTCVFAVRSGNGSSVAVGVTVRAAPLTVTPGTLTFVNPYPTPGPQTFSVSGGAMPYHVVTSDCTGLVEGASGRRRSGGSPPSQTFTVTPAYNVVGTCGLTVQSGDNQSVVVIVKLTASAAYTLMEQPVQIDVSTSHQLAIFGGLYPRTLDISACAGYLTGSSVNFDYNLMTNWSVDATASLGTCPTIARTADGQYVINMVEIVPTRHAPPLQAMPSELRFDDHKAPPQEFAVIGGHKPYRIDDEDCMHVAHVSTVRLDEVYRVEPDASSNGKSCTIEIHSADGQKVMEHVEVGKHPLEVRAPREAQPIGTLTFRALTFASPIAPPQMVRLSGATTYRLDPSACAGVVTVNGSAGVYTVTPVRGNPSGATCAFGVEADGASQTISVTVAPPLAVTPKALEFATIHAGPQRVRVSGAQPISFVVSPNCAQALSVEPGAVSGFVQEFLVRAVREPNASPCTITFIGNGQIVPLTVNVRTHPRRQ